MSVGVDDPGSRQDKRQALRAGAAMVAVGLLARVQIPTPRAVAIGLAIGIAAGLSDRTQRDSDSFDVDWRLAQVEDSTCRNRDNIDRLLGLVERSAARS